MSIREEKKNINNKKIIKIQIPIKQYKSTKGTNSINKIEETNSNDLSSNCSSQWSEDDKKNITIIRETASNPMEKDSLFLSLHEKNLDEIMDDYFDN